MTRSGNEDSTRTSGLRTASAARDPSRLWLVAAHEYAVELFELPEVGRVVLGRARTCDVPVEHPSVSRQHAELVIGDLLAIRDLGSHNGTRLHGARLSEEALTEVRPGDVIELGDARVIVQRNAPAAADAVARVVGSPRSSADTPSPTSGASIAPAARGGWLDRIRPVLERIAAGTIPVLLLGETGVGKEVLGELIHRMSPRAAAPLLKLNCAALSETLLESELFGHERGAFSGAATAKPGLLESAHEGTVFLDEVGDLAPATQAKLLRVLEDGAVLRVGSVKPRSIDVRYVAATNRDLERAVSEGTFRGDLLFRLNAFTLVVPPLRERKDEIEALAHALLGEASARMNRRPPAITPDALASLAAYAWPGNVRELRNAVERALLLCHGDTLGVEHLPAALAGGAPAATEALTAGARGRLASTGAPAGEPSLHHELADIERKRIVDALERAGGNQTEAAKLLGISRRTLVSRLTAYGLPRPRKPRP